MRTVFASLLALAVFGACSAPSGTNAAAKLAAVDALPKPSLPPWIASISPTATAPSLAQIRIIFAKPVTKVESLEGDGPRDVLSHVRLDPVLPGRFVVLTPRMIGFVADRALPVGSRVRVTLTAGLRDLDGDSLAKDLAWTFTTDAVAFTDLPSLTVPDSEQTSPPVSLAPTLKVTANVAVDPASLSQHATLNAGHAHVALDATLEATPTPPAGSDAAAQFDASQNTYTYDLRPLSALKMATTYTLAIAPGVEPLIGNVATADRYSGQVRTYDTLTVVPSTVPSPGSFGARFANGDPSIVFTNVLDPTTVAANVTVSPAPANVKAFISVLDQSNVIALNPYAFDPNATYVVTLGAGIKDVFGQTLGKSQTITIHTSSFTPGAWAPSGTTIIPAGSGVDLNFYATNLPQNLYQTAFARMTPEEMLGDQTATDALPQYADWTSQTIAGAKNNAQSVVRVPVQRQLGAPFGALAYGFRSALNSDDDPGTTGIAQITNLGVFAQWFPTGGIVLVQHLSDGAPVNGATVSILARRGSDPATPFTACASGTTGVSGEFDLQEIDLERCYAGASANQAPNLGVIVREGADAATLTTYDYSGVYNYNIQSGWTTGAPLSRGTVASDRNLYQPGEHAELTGFAYYVANGAVVAEKNAVYKLQLQGPSGATTSVGTATTDAYGIFSFPYAFSAQQALGYYTITATGPSGNQIIGTMRVAEFKPPNFKMAVSVDRTSAVGGAVVSATGAAAYLFGSPLDGGKATIDVTRSAAALAPKGWDDYTFGPQWFWPEQQPDVQTDVAQSTTTFDKSGNVALPVTVPNDLPFPMTYTVDMTATDVSNLSVSDTATFLALPADAVIGLASDTVVAAGSALPVKVIVTDADGKPISGRSVHLDLQKMTYTSATQDQDGGESAQDAVRYDTVDQADVTSSIAPVVVKLHPPDNASYRVRANFSGATSVASASDEQVFAYGAGESDWSQGGTTSVTVTMDKKKYKVGDTATAIAASPFDHSDVYVAVIRNGTLARATLKNVNGAPRFTFKVTPAMLPNAALEMVVVRRGAPLASVKPGSLDSLARVGISPFEVDVSDRYLKVGIVPGSATIEPGARQRLSFTVTDAHGAAVRGKIVAMVVNDAVLQLSDYRMPDLVATVFADQPISTRFADNRENINLQTQTAPSEKGFGFGGGFLEGAANTRVRTNFQPLAYYGTVTTDASGKASVTFKAPDDLTTWRVMAVAVDGDDAHFGTNDATFISTLPLMANPLLPQFARPGDRFDLGLSVMNTSGAAGSLSVDATLEGALSFITGSPTTLQTNEDLATGMQAYRFPVTVGTPAPTSVTFKAVSDSRSDGFKVPFDIRDRATTESVVDSGAGTKADVPISLDRGGTLQIDLANSAIPPFVTPAASLMNDDPMPITSSYASRAILAFGLAKLAPTYRLELGFDAQSVGTQSLRSLMALQGSDGGFKSYTGATESDPFDSAYALVALAFVRGHGGSVDASAMTHAQRFSSDVLANPERFSWCKDPACVNQVRFEMLWALAAAGDRRTDFLQAIVAKSDTFDTATQIRLARYLLATPGWQLQGTALAQRLRDNTYLTGRYTVAQVPSRWGWLDSLVDAQAEMAQLLIETHAPAGQVDGVVRALAAQRCRCGWPTIESAAAAIEAISAYAGTEHLSGMNVTASFGGQTIAKAQFGSQASSQSFRVAASQLHGSALTIASSGGTVHYLATYTYDVPNNAAGTLTAFRVVREVSDVGASTPLATMDLAAIVAPIQLDAGKVFDIGVRMIVDHPVDRVVIDDPLPAGLEAVDTTFKTASTAVIPQSDSWDIDSQQIYGASGLLVGGEEVQATAMEQDRV